MPYTSIVLTANLLFYFNFWGFILQEERVEKVRVTTGHVTFERIKATWSGGIWPQTGGSGRDILVIVSEGQLENGSEGRVENMDSGPLTPTTSEPDKDMPLPPPDPKLVKAVDQARIKVEAAEKVIEQKKEALVKIEASEAADGSNKESTARKKAARTMYQNAQQKHGQAVEKLVAAEKALNTGVSAVQLESKLNAYDIFYRCRRYEVGATCDLRLRLATEVLFTITQPWLTMICAASHNINDTEYIAAELYFALLAIVLPNLQAVNYFWLCFGSV
ncbi:hypothetical protein K438DRAFT_1761210 [Mycena galopus ATCC 62051]|nr:hypothetical protein K438DRAFT_1761210 [Mycena galopus ATCC 62051]